MKEVNLRCYLGAILKKFQAQTTTAAHPAAVI